MTYKEAINKIAKCEHQTEGYIVKKGLEYEVTYNGNDHLNFNEGHLNEKGD